VDDLNVAMFRMEPAALACIELLLIFAVIVLLLRRGAQLKVALFAASLCTAVVSGIGPGRWPGMILGTATDTDFLLLCCMIWMMIALSGVQEAGGQNTRLVEELEEYVHNPRVRLLIFPALVGLLPMPGGALFSCPMVGAVAGHMDVGESRRTLINYWFRHIWETAWPLYPGYILASSLLGLSLSVICRYTFPLIFLAVGVGWFFFLRDIPSDGLCGGRVPPFAPGDAVRVPAGKRLVSLLGNFLPILVVLAGAAFFTPLLAVLFPGAPKQTAFGLALCAALGAAVVQNREKLRGRAVQLAFSAHAGRIIVLLFAIFLFKDMIVASGIVRELSEPVSGLPAVAAACLILPFIAGLLTGVMVGFVGLSFPVLLDLIRHAGLQEYTAPLIILSLAAGNCGQMLSPLHVCLIVTCEFFNTQLPRIWRSLIGPVAALFAGGGLLACIAAAAGAHF
jgi:integral membrane protein (TIGR00529 family)